MFLIVYLLLFESNAYRWGRSWKVETKNKQMVNGVRSRILEATIFPTSRFLFKKFDLFSKFWNPKITFELCPAWEHFLIRNRDVFFKQKFVSGKNGSRMCSWSNCTHCFCFFFSRLFVDLGANLWPRASRICTHSSWSHT